MKTTKFVSVILCTHNGSRKIGKSIESLLDQDYPSDQYEVLVVNDGSTDSTASIISQYPVKILTHAMKRGLAASRNSGLKKANGEIIICYDDDCIADNKWMRNLVRGFDNTNILGCGGLMILSNRPTLTDEYLYQSGYASPIPMTLGRSRSIVIRFLSYLQTNLVNPQSKYVDGTKVFELPGATSSFRKSDLQEVGGWDESYTNNAEDIELCRKLKIKYPKKFFIVTPSAKVVHEHQMTFYAFLNKERIRGKLRKKYYKLKNEVPPYFPGPILMLSILVASLFLNKIMVYVLVMPLIIYPWWIYRSFTQRNIKLLSFPYMQWLHESAIILGMI